MPSSYWWHVVTWCYMQRCLGDVWGTGDFQVCLREDATRNQAMALICLCPCHCFSWWRTVVYCREVFHALTWKIFGSFKGFMSDMLVSYNTMYGIQRSCRYANSDLYGTDFLLLLLCCVSILWHPKGLSQNASPEFQLLALGTFEERDQLLCDLFKRITAWVSFRLMDAEIGNTLWE